MECSDIVYGGKRSMAFVAPGAGRFLGQISGGIEGHQVFFIAAAGAVNMTIKIGRVTGCTRARTAGGITPAATADFQCTVSSGVGVTIGAKSLVC